jgi:Tfp pilus assembly protein PilF
MKKWIFIITLSLLAIPFTYAQQRDDAENLIDQGVKLHDKGEYAEAIKKYDEALKVDKDNLRAYAEKGYTYLAMKRYFSCIDACKKAIETHPGEKELNMVYVNYGTCLDEQKKPEEAINIYDDGIKVFPDYYLLHFNKAITLAELKKYDEAILVLQKSIMLNPRHPGSHSALARILDMQGKHVPSLLAFCRFFVLEQEGDRAEANLALLKELLNGSGAVKKTGKNSITINVDAESLKDSTADGKKIENSFATTDMILTMGSVIGREVKMTDIDKFAFKITTVCNSLKESKKDNYGFYWDYYVPYFVEMNEKGYVTTFAYLANASKDKSAQKWIKNHKDEITVFYNWSKNFDWKKQ